MTRPDPQTSSWPDAEALAAAAAHLLVQRLHAVQRERGTASVVLTGGGIGIAALRAVREEPERDQVDWRRVDVWWGDERWLAPGDPERNETQARVALLDHLDLAADRVHPMPADSAGDVEAAAARYAAELGTPAFDVVLLGIGPEGHTASIFPGSPAVDDPRLALPVRDCPKPPPTRITLGLRALNRAQEVWFLASGLDKASAVATAVRGDDAMRAPAAAVRGLRSTRWLLDEAAAADLPR